MNAATIHVNRLLYFLQRAPRIGILSHVRADADSLGSQLALAHGFRKRGVSVFCGNVGPIAEKLQFLPGMSGMELLDSKQAVEQFLASCDVLVFVDTGDYKRTGLLDLGVKPEDISIPTINIDHHPDNTQFALVNVVLSDVSSTAEIVGVIFEGLGIPLTPHASTCLLTGIFNDTDSFKNANVRSSTMAFTAKLLAAGADMQSIARHFLRDKTVGTLRLWGDVLSRMRRHPELGIVSTVVTQEDLQRHNATTDDVEGVANFFNRIPDARATLLLSEQGEQTLKGSFRTLHDDVDVSRLARLLGGGGHTKAAGFTVPGRLVLKDEAWYIQPVTTSA